MKPSTRRLIRRCARILQIYAAVCAVFFVYGVVQQHDEYAKAQGHKLMRDRIANIK